MSSFSLADLCDLADVTPRTVRYYVVQGLLRAPTGSGPAARYDAGHLYRLRLIRRLQKEHLPLLEIRRRLDALTDGDVERLMTEPAPTTDSAADYVARALGSRVLPSQVMASPLASPSRTASQVPPSLEAPSPAMPSLGPAAATSAIGLTSHEPARSQWERIVLTPEIEIHVRRPLGRIQNRRVDRLLESARAILKEDPE